MKKQIYLIFFLSFFVANVALAQCPVGDITLTTQAEVDNFTTTYPGCSHLLGSLVIGPSTDITNLNGLSGIAQIDMSLVITGNQVLSDVSGLANNLVSISTGGGINISNNSILTAFDFSGVSAPNVGNFYVANNPILTSALLPTDVTAIAGLLLYEVNPMLATVSEMDDLVSIGGYISFNGTLINTFPVYPSLASLGTGLYVSGNANITALPAMPSLNSIGGDISIYNNPNLTDFDLSGVSTHDIGNMGVLNNALLTSALLPTDVTAIAGLLLYQVNPMLATVSEMDDLVSIGGYLSFYSAVVNTFPVFPSLTSLGTGLYISQNPNITALPAMPNLSSIGGEIYIYGNPNLTDFDLSGVLSPIKSCQHCPEKSCQV